ncbi:hypothetical protein [Aurantimonas sp. A3-2-R12]|nr:hypothetical protein [Aurantimonas sp. A3-2-R12]
MTAEKIDGKARAAWIIDELKRAAGALTIWAGMEPGGWPSPSLARAAWP